MFIKRVSREVSHEDRGYLFMLVEHQVLSGLVDVKSPVVKQERLATVVGRHSPREGREPLGPLETHRLDSRLLV